MHIYSHIFTYIHIYPHIYTRTQAQPFVFGTFGRPTDQRPEAFVFWFFWGLLNVSQFLLASVCVVYDC